MFKRLQNIKKLYILSRKRQAFIYINNAIEGFPSGDVLLRHCGRKDLLPRVNQSQQGADCSSITGNLSYSSEAVQFTEQMCYLITQKAQSTITILL